MWFHFMDMHSGGYSKTQYEHIFIKARSKDDAIEIFENRFNTNPSGVACSCCGENFSINSDKSIKNLASFWIKAMGLSINDFYNSPKVCIIE